MTIVNSTSSAHIALFYVDVSTSVVQCIFSVTEAGLYNATFSVTEASSYSHLLEVMESTFDEATSLIDASFSSSTIPLLIDQQISSEMHIDGVTLTNQARIDTYPFLVVSNVEFAFYIHLFDISLSVHAGNLTADLGKCYHRFFQHFYSFVPKWSSCIAQQHIVFD